MDQAQNLCLQVQLSIVHPVRNSLRYVTLKDCKRVAAYLRAIYTTPTLEASRTALGALAEHWGERCPTVTSGWERNWERLTPFFGYSARDPQGGLHHQRH